jgi:hypothetical protein
LIGGKLRVSPGHREIVCIILERRTVKLKAGTIGAASVLAAATLGLSMTGPASAASAGIHLRITIEKLPASAVAWADAPASPAPATCVAAQQSPTFTAASRLDWCAVFDAVLTVYEGTTPVGSADVGQTDYASWKVSSRTWNPTRQDFQRRAPAAGC